MRIHILQSIAGVVLSIVMTSALGAREKTMAASDQRIIGVWRYVHTFDKGSGPVAGTVEFRANGTFRIDITRGRDTGLRYSGDFDYQVRAGRLRYSQLEEVDPGPALSAHFFVDGDTLYFLRLREGAPSNAPDDRLNVEPLYKLMRVTTAKP